MAPNVRQRLPDGLDKGPPRVSGEHEQLSLAVGSVAN
jgi:hypothetical protein